MTIQDAFSPFDVLDTKGIDDSEIVSVLLSLDENENSKPEYGFELLAFRLVPYSEDNHWGFYFGPQSTFVDANGSPVYSPALDEITVDAIDYWTKRYKETINPLLKMRYAGLVWDFEQKVAHRSHCANLYRTYVDSMIKVCNEDYCSHPVVTTNTLERLFDVVNKQSADLIVVKTAFCDFEKRHGTDESVRCWASQFQLMIENKKCFTQVEKEHLVAQHESRLSRLYTPNTEGHINPWIVQSQGELLAKYYNSIQDKENIRRILNIVENAFRNEEKSMSAIQIMGNLQHVYQTYRLYGLEDEATRLTTKLQKLGEKAKDEMQTHSFEFQIPVEAYQQIDRMFGEQVESMWTRWRNFTVYFIPNLSNEEKSLEELTKYYPLKYMMGTNIMDLKGRPMSYIGSYNSDPEGQLILHVAQKLNIDAIFLGMAINKLLTTNTLTTENVMSSLIKQSPLFDENRYEVIATALNYFIDGKYLLFCHLIIPQIECAICNLVELSGASILKPQRNKKGFQLRTLDELLREQIIRDVFTEDGAYYLRIVLTDQRALNIRNLLCHGVLPPQYFGLGTAGRLLHVLIMLGMVQQQESVH